MIRQACAAFSEHAKGQGFFDNQPILVFLLQSQLMSLLSRLIKSEYEFGEVGNVAIVLIQAFDDNEAASERFLGLLQYSEYMT